MPEQRGSTKGVTRDKILIAVLCDEWREGNAWLNNSLLMVRQKTPAFQCTRYVEYRVVYRAEQLKGIEWTDVINLTRNNLELMAEGCAAVR